VGDAFAFLSSFVATFLAPVLRQEFVGLGSDKILVAPYHSERRSAMIGLLQRASKGARPGFSTAAPPEAGRALYEYLVARARGAHPQVGAGRFGADMQVTLTNDGPVTFWLRVPPPRGG
jgi:hypothetical protein